MKIKVKDIKPNPYRRTDLYPTEIESVQELVKSIEKNGFWDNLVARKKDGEVQIAYGHHRIEALKIAEGYGEDFEFDLTIKDLDERTMITIMADENKSKRANSIEAIDESIMVARDYLLANPKEAEKYSLSPGRQSVGRHVISKFLGWQSSAQVGKTLERIKLMEDAVVTKESMYLLPTQSHANAFGRAIKDPKISGVTFSEFEQKEIAQYIVKNDVKRAAIENLVQQKAMDKKFPPNKIEKDEDAVFIAKMDKLFKKLLEVSSELNMHLLFMDEVKINEFKYVDGTNIFSRADTMRSLKNAQDRIQKFRDYVGSGLDSETLDAEVIEIEPVQVIAS